MLVFASGAGAGTDMFRGREFSSLALGAWDELTVRETDSGRRLPPSSDCTPEPELDVPPLDTVVPVWSVPNRECFAPSLCLSSSSLTRGVVGGDEAIPPRSVLAMDEVLFRIFRQPVVITE